MKTKLLTLLTLLWMSLAAGAQVIPDTLLFVFKLHGQTRRFEMSFEEKNDTVSLIWGIERKLKWLSGTYTMMPENVENGSSLSFLQPEDKNHVTACRRNGIHDRTQSIPHAENDGRNGL